jgi:hypothetical protein
LAVTWRAEEAEAEEEAAAEEELRKELRKRRWAL